MFASARGFRTLTGWESEDAMRHFRNSGSHLEAMRNTRRIGAAKNARWSTDTRPEWAEALGRLAAVSFR